MKWWVSETFPFQLRPPWKSNWAKERQKSNSILDSLREGRKGAGIGFIGDESLGGFWQRIQGSSCWKPGLGEVHMARSVWLHLPDSVVNPDHCADCGDTWWEREGKAIARYSLMVGRRGSLQTITEKGSPDLRFESHYLDKLMTMDSRNKRKSVDNCICELN